MPRARFEPATPATKRPQTYALDRAATGIGEDHISIIKRGTLLYATKYGCLKTTRLQDSKDKK
jgi:hypothetical protein